MNSEILNQIQILNQHIVDLTEKSQDLINALKPNKGVDINTLITILAGLFGVVIGSLISYYFSKKITNESSKARFAIQKKNLIYSKIYKELIYMREQMELLPKNCFYFQIKSNLIDTKVGNYGNDNYWLAGTRDNIAPEFYTWKNIKGDVRITQINDTVLRAMTTLEKAVLDYFNSVNNFEAEFEKSQQDQRVRINIDTTLFFFDDFEKDKIIEKELESYANQTKEWYDARRELLLKIVNPVMEKPFLKEAKENFTVLKEKLNETYLVLEKLIKDIVNKYEYGKKI